MLYVYCTSLFSGSRESVKLKDERSEDGTQTWSCNHFFCSNNVRKRQSRERLLSQRKWCGIGFRLNIISSQIQDRITGNYLNLFVALVFHLSWPSTNEYNLNTVAYRTYSYRYWFTVHERFYRLMGKQISCPYSFCIYLFTAEWGSTIFYSLFFIKNRKVRELIL